MLRPPSLCGGGSPRLGGTDDEGGAGCVDDVVADGAEVVDLQDASDLDEEALEQAKVASVQPVGAAFGAGHSASGRVHLNVPLAAATVRKA